ncbi:MAG: hypothetical protein AB1540_15565 [Bdellovibrionota bacterium]
MAIDDTLTPQSTVKPVQAPNPPEPTDPAKLYEKNIELLYGIVAYFIPSHARQEALQEIAQTLIGALSESKYERYADLVFLRVAFEHIRSNPQAKSPIQLTIDEAFSLVLRDRFDLTCRQIGAAVGISEGSIRTRLERSRIKAFSDLATAEGASASRPGGIGRLRDTASTHICLRTRELIEDWDLSTPRMGSLTAPTHLIRSVDDCKKCEQVLETRLSSLSYFGEFEWSSPPEMFQKFPVSPLFVKEGKKVLFNWASAPWYLKALFEGLLATTLVLGVVLSIPRIKGLYEFWLERRLDLYSVAELTAGLGNPTEPVSEAHQNVSEAPASAPEAASESLVATSSDGGMTNIHGSIGPPAVALRPGAAKDEKLEVKPETEFVGRDSEMASSDRVYRVLIKTDAPEITKEQVAKVLRSVNFISADESSGTGAELPGGVMFDVFIPLKGYKHLVNGLAKLGETKIIITRAKERGKAGHTRLKVWLQRI